MPKGEARDRLAEQLEQRTVALLEERRRDKTVETGWLVGSAWAGVAWVSLVASTAVAGTEAWAGYLRAALEMLGVTTGALGVFILALSSALVAWKAACRIYLRLRARRKRPEYTYDI